MDTTLATLSRVSSSPERSRARAVRDDTFKLDEFEVAHQRVGHEERVLGTSGHQRGVVARLLDDQGAHASTPKVADRAVEHDGESLAILIGPARMN
jgi:hypothetical protein